MFLYSGKYDMIYGVVDLQDSKLVTRASAATATLVTWSNFRRATAPPRVRLLLTRIAAVTRPCSPDLYSEKSDTDTRLQASQFKSNGI